MLGNPFKKSEELIKRDEGYRSEPYKDSVGVLTIGYGRNLEVGISLEAANFLFKEDIRDVRADCLRFDWFHELSIVRQAVIENMIFNLGLTRFRGFKKAIKAIEEKNWHEAANEMMDSKWAKQVGKRADRLALMMITNEWPE